MDDSHRLQHPLQIVALGRIELLAQERGEMIDRRVGIGGLGGGMPDIGHARAVIVIGGGDFAHLRLDDRLLLRRRGAACARDQGHQNAGGIGRVANRA